MPVDNRERRSIFVGAERYLIWYLMSNYLQLAETFIEPDINYSEIAFCKVYENKINNTFEYDINSFVAYNKFHNFQISYLNKNTYPAISGYDNIFICDNFIGIEQNTDEYFIQFKKILSYFGKTNGQRVFLLIPDLIFKPTLQKDKKIYGANDYITVQDKVIAYIAYNTFLDSYIKMLRNYYSVSVYAIYTPFIIQHEDINGMVKINYDKITAGYRYNHPMLSIGRGVLTYDQLAKALYYIHKEDIGKEYFLGTQHNYNWNDIVNRKHTQQYPRTYI